MKKLAVLAVALVTATGAFGQGQITFSSNPTAPILLDDGSVPAVGSLMVGLYYSTDGSASTDTFTLEASSVSAIGPAGVFLGGIKSIEGVSGGTAIAVEIRAWSSGFGTYEEAVANGTMDQYAGVSGVLPNMVTLVNPGNPPNNVTTAGGFTGMTVTPIPEPSTIAFGILGGIGAMVLLRRRK